MTQPDYSLYRQRLLELRAALQGDMAQLEDAALNKDGSRSTSMPTSMAELGSENFDQEFTLRLLGGGQAAYTQIEAALEKIDEGTYGHCELCGVKIPKSRLDAIPFASMCVQCASQEEGHNNVNPGRKIK